MWVQAARRPTRASYGSGSPTTWVKPASSTRSEPVVVLDASAGVKIVLGTTGGGLLAGHVANDDEIAVPDHFHLECATALRRMGRFKLTLTDAQAATPRSTAVVSRASEVARASSHPSPYFHATVVEPPLTFPADRVPPPCPPIRVPSHRP